ncbi:DUF2793 domain-containing protein [Sphingomonas dokdonensis]|uniref:DUF2793 domain-containing protein n=1 Tax=Sphingomonas dokdonensis TaxID=344880 RepID=A0A245ZD55_9SPHN|nr:DUF2793 domain-containing protein [Sphingomonas dokdonensis]OWK27630.1 hypothetical protein SPDO_32180 [Sphingomonas dokdonensis]
MTELMSGDATPRLHLPLLHAGQAQKEVDHNEALALLDLAVQPVVLAIGLDVPPSQPAAGDCWIVGGDPVGDWAGQAHALAGWTVGGWRFVAPRPGMTVWRSTDGLTARYADGAWHIGEVRAATLVLNGQELLGAPQAPIGTPSGGEMIDHQAREALEAVLETLRVHHLIRR